MEENKGTMTITVGCERCKEQFKVNSGGQCQIKKKEYEIEGQSIFLTYYDCPKCGRRHHVQIDDATSLRMFNNVKRQFIVLSIAKKKDKEISKKQSAKFKKNRRDLSDYRMNLMKKYTNKEVYDHEDKSYFVLRFSV